MRFRHASDEQVPYSDLHPERFAPQQRYEKPSPDADRDVDHPPTPEEIAVDRARRVTARLGFEHLKGPR